MRVASAGVVVALTIVLVIGTLPAHVFGIADETSAHAVGNVQPANLEDTTGLAVWMDETMTEQMEDAHIPGAAVLLVNDGQVVVSKGYGYADLATQRPVDAEETVFSIGSTGKLLTWTAVMQGVEDGHLQLDQDVNEYLTHSTVSVPDTYTEPVTLSHLATHSAGFEDIFTGMITDDPETIRPMEDILAAHQPARVRPPGTFVAYSNYGTALAGHILAAQTGTEFTEYVDTRIFTPLGMDDSTYDQPLSATLEPRRAIGYTYQDGGYQPHEPVIWTLPPEGGSFRTTAADMGQFMLAHLNEGTVGRERILEEASVTELHRRHFSRSQAVPELNGMAFGFIEMDRNDERIVGHWGDTPRFKSLLALYPERDLGLFVVYNSPGGGPARFDLLQAFTDRYFPQSDAPVAAPPAGAAERARALSGDYRSLTIAESSWERILGAMTRTYTVGTTESGYLTTTRMGMGTQQWVERRPGVYAEVGGADMLVFNIGADGRATHLFRHSFAASTYERVPWVESQTVLQGSLGAGSVAFLSALLIWFGGPVWRRWRGSEAPNRPEVGARWLLGLVSALWLAVLAIFLLAWVNFNSEAASPSLLLQAGKVLRYVALVGTGGAVIVTGIAWRDAYWTRPVRLHYAVVTVLAILFAWQLSLLGIIPL